WVIGGKIMDLSITPVKFGAKPIAYLVVGQAVDQDMLNAVADQTGVAIATANGQSLLLTAPPGDATKEIFTTEAWQLQPGRSRLFEINGERHVTALYELEESGQARPRIVIAQSLAQARAAFATSRWMLFVPPALILIAVLFALTAGRRIVVVRQP